jgi:hypothetical protein
MAARGQRRGPGMLACQNAQPLPETGCVEARIILHVAYRLAVIGAITADEISHLSPSMSTRWFYALGIQVEDVITGDAEVSPNPWRATGIGPSVCWSAP